MKLILKNKVKLLKIIMRIRIKFRTCRIRFIRKRKKMKDKDFYLY